MHAKIFDGKKVADDICSELSKEVAKFKKKHKPPKLSVILVGDDPASKTYIKMKENACSQIGILSDVHKLPENTDESEVLSLIKKLNENKNVHGILVQFPLPKHINKNKVMKAICPKKDVDGFNPINIGNVLLGDETLAPCTPKAVITTLDNSGIKIEGKDVVIINHSNIIGKPLSLMLLNRDATVDVCHIKTKNLNEHTMEADIVIVAAGIPGLIKSDMVKSGVVIIDVGINKTKDGIKGDAEKGIEKKASFLTPVPGGIGPITIATLMKNTVTCYKNLL